MIEIKENDIRPKAIFDEYRRLAEQDARAYFGSCAKIVIDCPACGARESHREFQKIGFDYDLCDRCGTLYVNPRPEPEAFKRYYQDAPSVRYWATHFYKETETVRRKTVIGPKAEQVQAILQNRAGNEPLAWLADIGAGYGIFCEEIQKRLQPTPDLVAIEPAFVLSEVCQGKGLTVVPKFIEDVAAGDLPDTKGLRVATCFELIEHPYDPLQFLRSAQRLLGKGGLLILTTLNVKGFDLQVLWDKSNSIHPPHHINFFSTDSIQLLFDRAGFDVVDVLTPGRLDVDIVAQQRETVTDRFLRTLLGSDVATLKDFQIFLRDHRLSSHMMIVARSRG